MCVCVCVCVCVCDNETHTHLEVSREAVQQGDYDESDLIGERSLHFSMELDFTAGDLREGCGDGEGSRHRGQGGRWARNACVRATESRSDHVTTMKVNADKHACTSTLSHPPHPLPHCHTLTPSTSTVTPSHTPLPHCHILTHPPPHPPPQPHQEQSWIATLCFSPG